MKIALAHDWLNQMGGAENVLEVLVAMFPKSPIFTTIYAPELMPDIYKTWKIVTSRLNHMPGIHRHHQPYLPLYPAAVRSLDISGFDAILSNKSGFIHGLNTSPAQKHLCYCLAPTRYVWNYQSYAQRENMGRITDILLSPMITALRRWDYAAAQRVDYFCAISTDIQQRIKKYYHRDSIIIHPPIDTDRFQPIAQPTEDYYFIISRLIPYKRIDLAVKAFSKLGKRLVITGEGRDRAALESLAAPNVEFTGRLPWADVVKLMTNCKALVFPGYEDFGITPLEAQAAGRPVIAFGAGGALDTVIDGETGVYFHLQNEEALIEAVHRLEAITFDPKYIRKHAENFGIHRFQRQLRDWMGSVL